MKNNVEEFLVAYKAFETICRQEKQKDIKDYEEELGETNPKMQKIRYCRQTRNYCSHNDYEDFIQIHKGMIKFLKEEIKELKKKPIKKKVGKKAEDKKLVKKVCKTKKKKN